MVIDCVYLLISVEYCMPCISSFDCFNCLILCGLCLVCFTWWLVMIALYLMGCLLVGYCCLTLPCVLLRVLGLDGVY